MSLTDAAIRRDPDLVTPLKRCHEDPVEVYLHTVLPTGEVLPFSDELALTYEYPCTLVKEQDGLHIRLVYSSLCGIPLIAPVKSGRLRVQPTGNGRTKHLTTGCSMSAMSLTKASEGNGTTQLSTTHVR